MHQLMQDNEDEEILSIMGRIRPSVIIERIRPSVYHGRNQNVYHGKKLTFLYQ